MYKLVVSILLIATSVIYAESDYDLTIANTEYIGTYIPVSFQNAFTNGTKYSLSMKLNQKHNYHDILGINSTIIYSNVWFHDQYAIPKNEFMSYVFSKRDSYMFLVDDHQNEYIKISSSSKYYKEFEKYVLNRYLDELKKLSIVGYYLTDNNYLENANANWFFDLDVYHYYDDIDLLFYNGLQNGEYIGIQIQKDYINVFKMKPGEELSIIIDKKIYCVNR
jgi:hypothetical protein